MSPTARLNGVSYESEESRRYDKENLLWQFTVAIKSDHAGFRIPASMLKNKNTTEIRFAGIPETVYVGGVFGVRLLKAE